MMMLGDNMENANTLLMQDAECKKDDAVDKKTIQTTNLSKSQLKKVRKKEKWLERIAEKRLRERQKAKQKRAYARENNIDLGPSRKALKKSTMADSSCKLTVTIDLSFDQLMTDKDIAKLIKQILRCYTLNRRAIAPMQFSLTSFNGKSKQDMEKHNGYQHWDVAFYADSYLSVYPRDKIIYLTSESENVIECLDDKCVYVIGGLVDHNSHKGLCHKLADKEGVKHGRLPLDKFLHMKARKVLTIDHVFEILLRVTEGKTWQEAFLDVLPERKRPVLLSAEGAIVPESLDEKGARCKAKQKENSLISENTRMEVADEQLQGSVKDNLSQDVTTKRTVPEIKDVENSTLNALENLPK